MIVLPRPGPVEISEADAYIFGLMRQACAGPETAPGYSGFQLRRSLISSRRRRAE